MRFLFFISLIPVFVFGSLKERIIEDFATNLCSFNIYESHRALNEWKNSYVEDKNVVNSCRAFLFLLENKTGEARNLFESSFPKLKQQYPSLIKVSDIFYQCLGYLETDSVYLQQTNGTNARVFLCKRAWKISAVVGAILIGAGGLVACVAPTAGVNMIISGAGMITTGTFGSMDEEDERADERARQKRRDEEEAKRTSHSLPWTRRNDIQSV